MESGKAGILRDEYIPGVCNIGTAERRARRMFGWFGLGATVALWGLLAYFQARPAWRLLVFLTASSAASGFLQSAFHFCVNFGSRGLFNFGPEVGKTDTVTQAEFRKKDQRKALFIGALSAGIGAAVAAAAFLA